MNKVYLLIICLLLTSFTGCIEDPDLELVESADFTGAIVTDADFIDTYWYQTIWTDGVAYDENQA